MAISKRNKILFLATSSAVAITLSAIAFANSCGNVQNSEQETKPPTLSQSQITSINLEWKPNKELSLTLVGKELSLNLNDYDIRLDNGNQNIIEKYSSDFSMISSSDNSKIFINIKCSNIQDILDGCILTIGIKNSDVNQTVKVPKYSELQSSYANIVSNAMYLTIKGQGLTQNKDDYIITGIDDDDNILTKYNVSFSNDSSSTSVTIILQGNDLSNVFKHNTRWNIKFKSGNQVQITEFIVSNEVKINSFSYGSDINSLYIEIGGFNLPLIKSKYDLYLNPNTDNKNYIENFSIDEKISNSSNVRLVTSNSNMQNKDFTLYIKDSYDEYVKDIQNNSKVWTGKISFSSFVESAEEINLKDITKKLNSNLLNDSETFNTPNASTNAFDNEKILNSFVDKYNSYKSNSNINYDNGIKATISLTLEDSSIPIEYNKWFKVKYLLSLQNNVTTTDEYVFNNQRPETSEVYNQRTDVEYQTNDGIRFVNNKIVSFNNYKIIENLQIPDKLKAWDYEQGKYITSISINEIADEAFKGKNLKSITFPKELKKIGNNAFYNNALTSVDFSFTKVDSIGEGSFMHNSISTIKWNDYIREINRFSFANNNLKSKGANFESSKIETIKDYGFAYNPWWTITQDSWYQIIDDTVALPLTLRNIYVSSFEIDTKIETKPCQLGSFRRVFGQIYIVKRFDWRGGSAMGLRGNPGGEAMLEAKFFSKGGDMRSFWSTINVLNTVNWNCTINIKKWKDNLRGEMTDIITSWSSTNKIVYPSLGEDKNDYWGPYIDYSFITSGIEFYNMRLINNDFYSQYWDKEAPAPYLKNLKI